MDKFHSSRPLHPEFVKFMNEQDKAAGVHQKKSDTEIEAVTKELKLVTAVNGGVEDDDRGYLPLISTESSSLEKSHPKLGDFANDFNPPSVSATENLIELRKKMMGLYDMHRGEKPPEGKIQEISLAYVHGLAKLFYSRHPEIEKIPTEVIAVECVIALSEVEFFASDLGFSTVAQLLKQRMEFINGTSMYLPVCGAEFEKNLKMARSIQPAISSSWVTSSLRLPTFPSIARYVAEIKEREVEDLLAVAREKLLARNA